MPHSDSIRGKMAAIAIAHPNIALIKYWGKYDRKLNLPAAESLSITLDTLASRTTVQFDSTLSQDQLWLNGQAHRKAHQRVSACLDILRAKAGVSFGARISTCNNFPTAAGLASSASGFAALVTAANAALGLPFDQHFLSTVARQGSGSAARSLFGGYVWMHAGISDEMAYAEPLLNKEAWPLNVVIAVTTEQAKSVGSGEGMELSRKMSPYHHAWIDSVADDVTRAKQAIANRNFEQLAEISEHSCLKMHADMLATQPPLMYWNAATLTCLQRIRQLREDGVNVFFTVDAGPQVKAVCEPSATDRVEQALQDIPGVLRTLRCGLGQGAHVTDAEKISDVD